MIDQLLKSKYHANHLGILRDKRLETIDTLVNKVARNAIGLTPSFPTKAIHRTTKETGLCYAPIKARATQMGIEHITEVLNKLAEREYIAFAHAKRLPSIY